jgi:serine/threonine protein kinase
MSPELIDPQQFGLQHSRPTESSDCYALGMVIYETISGNLPFHNDADLTVFVKVIQGKRPPRGPKFRKDLWMMLEQCWESQPRNRPSVGDVLRFLETYTNPS